MKYLVTGCAGFIGFHVTKKLIENGHEVICCDNLNDYYDQNLKFSRLSKLFDDDFKVSEIIKKTESWKDNNSIFKQNKKKSLTFYLLDIQNEKNVENLFFDHSPEIVIHLAAQAGVRYSITNPEAYISSNLIGFFNILETSKNFNVKHLVYASSSSVYGSNLKLPFSENDSVNHPLSLYASTKKSNEMLAHSYSNIYQIPTTGLRFFTVYGPWGRPDMSLFLFTKAILNNEEIDVFNFGKHKRDFTYIDDIVEGTIKVANFIPAKNNDWNGANPTPYNSNAPWRVFNIANGNSIPLMSFIENIEEKLNKKARINFLPLQPGDVPETHADISLLSELTGYVPKTSLKAGVNKFIDWYVEYYKN
jgi:UDP-glucuronate 4-epimerase